MKLPGAFRVASLTMLGYLLGVGVMAPSVRAQQVPSAPVASAAGAVAAPGDVTPASAVLGPLWKSETGGIQLSPPVGVTTIIPKAPDQIVEFDYPGKQWTITIRRTVLPTRPTGPPPPPGPDGHVGPAPALTEWQMTQQATTLATDDLKLSLGAVKVERSEVVNGGKDNRLNIGLVALRYTLGVSRRLRQLAIVQSSALVYYFIEFNSPATDQPDDPDVVVAAATFSQMLDTLSVIDQTALKNDQDNRFFATRALETNWNDARYRMILIPERWLRIRSNGKDVGYMYAVEEPDRLAGFAAVKIGVRLRRMDHPGVQFDSETWMYVTTDSYRSHEKWTDVGFLQDNKSDKKETIYEVGAADYSDNKPVADRLPDGKPLNTSHTESLYHITVADHSALAPRPLFERPAGPQYLPQACEYLLPRLVLLREPKNYLFYTWVPSVREIMLLYCNVLPEDNVTLNGQKVAAVQVQTRIGREGPITTDFMTRDGQYLGTVAHRTGDDGSMITEEILPTDAATLVGIWGQPDLTRPGAPPR